MLSVLVMQLAVHLVYPIVDLVTVPGRSPNGIDLVAVAVRRLIVAITQIGVEGTIRHQNEMAIVVIQGIVEETLETGVFRLRPATAKAAEALAQQRANVRPRNQQDERNSHDSSNRGPRPGRDAGRPATVAAGTAAGAGAAAPASRGFGSRIKDYLTGYAPDDAAQPAPEPAEAGAR